MTKQHLSVSQVKKYMKSPSSRAGAYLLGIRDEFKNDAMVVGNAFHLAIEKQSIKEGRDYLKLNIAKLEDPAKAEEALSILRDNYLELNPIKADQHEVPFDKDLGYGINFKGFVDGIAGDTILEYKSAAKLSHIDDKPMARQAINNYEEYELQVWLYMRATGLKKAKLIEVVKSDTTIHRAGSLKKQDIIDLCKDFNKEDSKLTIKDIIAKYQPKRPSGQVIDFVWTDNRDKEMNKKFGNIIREMNSLYKKYKK